MADRQKTPMKKFSFGICDFALTNPPRAAFTSNTKVLNVTLSFEDALKFALAVDEGVRQINRYKRSTREGKRTALNLAIFLDKQRISVNETKLPRD
jgi:hypothetical protein